MITFLPLNYEDLKLVLAWRTSPHVTEQMYTDVKKDLSSQIAWFDKVKEDPTQHHWIIKYKEDKIGIISLNEINKRNRSAKSGFYIGKLEYSMLASRILPYFLNFIFLEMNLNKLYIEVMSKNENMIKMDLHYGFRHVGTLEQHVFKDGIFHDVELLELLKDRWLNDYKKYHKLKVIIEGVN